MLKVTKWIRVSLAIEKKYIPSPGCSFPFARAAIPAGQSQHLVNAVCLLGAVGV